MPQQLSPNDLASRRSLDWRVVTKMSTDAYRFTAHRTPQDAGTGANPIVKEREARFALHYRAWFRVKTLVGPSEYSPYTIIRVDISNALYPFREPSAWVVEDANSRLPYSPHFARHAPICNGTIWRRNGQILLGHYLIHLARLLNWDEQLESGYGGYNPAAIAWWKKHIGRPITPDLKYPVLPADEAYGIEDQSFRRLQPRGSFRRVG